jgi:putative chitinase
MVLAPTRSAYGGPGGEMIHRKYFFDNVRFYIFKSLNQGQVDGLNRYLDYYDDDNPRIPDKHHLDDRTFAYVLATVFWETAQTMQPVKEYGSERYLKGKPYYPWYGRGDVQLTWEENYKRQDAKLGMQGSLVKNPDLALRPDISLKICILGMLDGDFTGKCLADFFTDSMTDWYDARTIVNGHDRAGEIADYAEKFSNAITRL